MFRFTLLKDKLRTTLWWKNHGVAPVMISATGMAAGNVIVCDKNLEKIGARDSRY